MKRNRRQTCPERALPAILRLYYEKLLFRFMKAFRPAFFRYQEVITNKSKGFCGYHFGMDGDYHVVLYLHRLAPLHRRPFHQVIALAVRIYPAFFGISILPQKGIMFAPDEI